MQVIVEQPARADAALAAGLEGLSRTRCQALIRAGAVELNGTVLTNPSQRVVAGDRMTVEMPPPEPASPEPQAIPLEVLYEDAALIVIDKPAGLVVHPAAGHHDGTLVNALLAHCGDSLSGIGGVMRPGIVHRLDKDTSGVMVVAKTDAAHRALAAEFADHGRSGTLTRRYQALVWGAPQPPDGVVDRPLGRHPTDRQRFAVRAGGKRAVTHYKTAERLGGVTNIMCTLETGRTHQIRVHMADLGVPLVGDKVYGAGFATKANRLPEPARALVTALGRQALHAGHLGFSHPVTGQLMQFDAPPPADFAALLTALRETKFPL